MHLLYHAKHFSWESYSGESGASEQRMLLGLTLQPSESESTMQEGLNWLHKIFVFTELIALLQDLSLHILPFQ